MRGNNKSNDESGATNVFTLKMRSKKIRGGRVQVKLTLADEG